MTLIKLGISILNIEMLEKPATEFDPVTFKLILL